MTKGMYGSKDIRKDGLLKMKKLKERDRSMRWQKIDSAPVDGTKIEAKRDDGITVIAWWDGKEWMCKELQEIRREDAKWQKKNNHTIFQRMGCTTAYWEPTHWRSRS